MAPNSPYSRPPPPLTGDPEAVLERHESALAGLRAGVAELEGSPSYLMLVGDEVGPETVAKVGAATEGAIQLWPLIDAADSALDHVRHYLNEHGSRGRNATELARLLSQRWITPPPDVAIGSGPLALSEVLEAIRSRYDDIRQWVSKINELWFSVLPRIDAARETLTRLEAEVDALGIPEPLIGRARALAADLEARLVADPLGVVPGDGPQLDAEVMAAVDQVAALRSGHDSFDEDLRAAEPLLASLRLIRAQAEAAASESRAKVLGPHGMVRVPAPAVIDGPKGLAERLDALHKTGDTLTWGQRRSILDAWLRTARKLGQQLTNAEAVNKKPLVERDELRGRLRAYRAKMAATGRAEDLELSAIVDKARAELFTAPTSLEAAAAELEELARRLRS